MWCEFTKPASLKFMILYEFMPNEVLVHCLVFCLFWVVVVFVVVLLVVLVLFCVFPSP